VGSAARRASPRRTSELTGDNGPLTATVRLVLQTGLNVEMEETGELAEAFIADTFTVTASAAVNSACAPTGARR
jgi:hypothetical protein